MGKLTISMAIFNSYVSLPDGKHVPVFSRTVEASSNSVSTSSFFRIRGSRIDHDGAADGETSFGFLRMLQIELVLVSMVINPIGSMGSMSGIYANMAGVYWWYMLPYIAYMDPMGIIINFIKMWGAQNPRNRFSWLSYLVHSRCKHCHNKNHTELEGSNTLNNWRNHQVGIYIYM